MYIYLMGLVLSILSTYMFVCHMCLVPGEAREPLDILLESEMLVRLHKVLGIERGSSARAASDLDHWAISPALIFMVFIFLLH